VAPTTSTSIPSHGATAGRGSQATNATAPAANRAVANKARVVLVPCSEPDPFAAAGGVGICVDDYWLKLWMPSATTRRGGK
jgi:hypothetical protein